MSRIHSKHFLFRVIRPAIDAASILAIVPGALILRHVLGPEPSFQPVAIRNSVYIALWLLGAMVLVASGVPFLFGRVTRMLARIAAIARLALAALLLIIFVSGTEIGVVGIGHRYWMNRAREAASPQEAQRCLEIVFASTQYGRDVAKSGITSLPDGTRRRELESAWCRLAGEKACPGGAFPN